MPPCFEKRKRSPVGLVLAFALVLAWPSTSEAGYCVAKAPRNACRKCKVESHCGGSAKTNLCMRNKPRSCKRKRRKTTSVKKRRGRKMKRPTFKKVAIRVGGEAIAAFRVDLLPAHQGDELVFVVERGLRVTDLNGKELARESYRGAKGGGDALRIKELVLTADKKPAVVSIWSWCKGGGKKAQKCADYEDLCWGSESGLSCNGPKR